MAKIDSCDCGNKTDIQTMEWVDKVFISINVVIFVIYIIFFILNTNMNDILKSVNKFVLLSVFGIYSIFIMYCLLIFVKSFYNYYFTLPANCECKKTDNMRFVLYIQGILYSLNLLFILGLILYIAFSRVVSK